MSKSKLSEADLSSDLTEVMTAAKGLLDDGKLGQALHSLFRAVKRLQYHHYKLIQ